MKRLWFFLALLLPTNLSAQDFVKRYAGDGQLILTNLSSAPFPHPQRADGRTFKDKFFSAADHYRDSSVAIFIPKGLRENEKADFVVHFHGWNNSLTNVLARHELIDQFVESRRHAILVVPQGPKNAPDSFGGKLEDTDGFEKFMAEVLAVVRSDARLRKAEVGKVILSGHSGGFQVMSSILTRGGLTDHVKEVWIFDGLYARAETFVKWFEQANGRLINIYTENGGTKRQTESLIAAMNQKSTPLLSKNEKSSLSAELQTNRLISLFTELAHDDVLQGHRTFRQFLQTSCLEAWGNNSTIISPRRRDVPGKRTPLPLGTLFVPDFVQIETNKALDVVLFFHGADWCAQQNFYDARKKAALVSITSTNYEALFARPEDFAPLLESVSKALADGTNSIQPGKICVASFSGGYMAVRAILKNPELAERISDVVLADSLYASRKSGDTNQLDDAQMEPFLNFARRATEGKSHFWFSQLYPPLPEHRSNTTTLAANYLIERLGVKGSHGDAINSRGMQLLYRADKGNFHVLGYAGMTTQDHFEHFYAISELLRNTSLAPIR